MYKALATSLTKWYLLFASPLLSSLCAQWTLAFALYRCAHFFSLFKADKKKERLVTGFPSLCTWNIWKIWGLCSTFRPKDSQSFSDIEIRQVAKENLITQVFLDYSITQVFLDISFWWHIKEDLINLAVFFLWNSFSLLLRPLGRSLAHSSICWP